MATRRGGIVRGLRSLGVLTRGLEFTGRAEQTPRTGAQIAASEAHQRVPQYGLIAGDDRTVEPPFELRDDPECRDVRATDEVGVDLAARGLDDALAPELGRRRAIGVAAAQRMADGVHHLIAGCLQECGFLGGGWPAAR